MIQNFKTLPALFAAFPTEAVAIEHLTSIRFADGRFCSLCANVEGAEHGRKIGELRTKDEGGAMIPSGMFKCYACRKRFSIRVGTIFQDTKLPLRTWYAAIWMITNHPKGIASTTLATDLGITQKSAWFVLHRLRHAARTPSFNRPLGSDGKPVEADETFVGGRAKNRPLSERKANRESATPLSGIAGKTVVMGLLERGGEVRAGVVEDTRKETLAPIIHYHVQAGATVYTDEHRAYSDLGADFAHGTVAHAREEYVRGPVHTNSIEGFWSILKRQIIGTHHWVSPKHLDRYVVEIAHRYNSRDVARGERVNTLLGQIEGPLRYKVLIA